MDDGGWIKALFFLVIFGSAIVRLISQAVSRSRKSRNEKPARPLREFLEDVRRDLREQSQTGRSATESAGQGRDASLAGPEHPDTERAMLGESSPTETHADPSAPREGRGLAPWGPDRGWQRDPSFEWAAPAQDRFELPEDATAQPAKAQRNEPRSPRRHRTRAESGADLELAWTSLPDAATSFSLLPSPASRSAVPASALRPATPALRLQPMRLAGLELRQAILAQTILGPPRGLELLRARGLSARGQRGAGRRGPSPDVA